MSDPAAARRRYNSALRTAQADQTRSAVLAAATGLFTERGWGGTGMRDVARAAGVSVETVYANFGSKAELLKQALDVAVVGDVDPVPLAERAVFRRIAEGTTHERVEATADFLADLHPRVARLRRVLNQAAGSDPQLAELYATSTENERESVRQAVHAVLERPAVDDVVDAVYAIQSTEVFLLLTDTRRWSIAHYRQWIADMIRTILHL